MAFGSRIGGASAMSRDTGATLELEREAFLGRQGLGPGMSVEPAPPAMVVLLDRLDHLVSQAHDLGTDLALLGDRALGAEPPTVSPNGPAGPAPGPNGAAETMALLLDRLEGRLARARTATERLTGFV